MESTSSGNDLSPQSTRYKVFKKMATDCSKVKFQRKDFFGNNEVQEYPNHFREATDN
jgi:hypothetical protein